MTFRSRVVNQALKVVAVSARRVSSICADLIAPKAASVASPSRHRLLKNRAHAQPGANTTFLFLASPTYPHHLWITVISRACAVTATVGRAPLSRRSPTG